MTTKHTPGPWVANGRHVVTANSTIAHQIIIASASAFDPRSEHEANARLIAAAPDLLGALQEIIELATSEAETLSELGKDDEDTAMWAAQAWEMLEAARAAIAKATTP